MSSPDQTDDDIAPSLEQIVARSKQGDAWAFRRLVESYQRYAFSLAFRIVCNEEDARDITQETFIRVWNRIGGYTGEAKFSSWLYKIVVNLAFDRLKGEKRRRRLFLALPVLPEDRVPDTGTALDDEIVNRDLAEKIRKIGEQLPLKQRMVFVLRDLQDLSVEEVAEILEMSPGSVKTNLCYARQRIAQRLKHTEAGQ